MVVFSYSNKELPSLRDYLVPYLSFFLGIFLTTLGWVVKETYFRKFEVSESRFYFLDKLLECFFLGWVVYPLVSLIDCTSFDNYLFKMCTKNKIDHPIYAFQLFFVDGRKNINKAFLLIFLFALVLIYLCYSYTKLKLTRKTSKIYKSILENIRVLMVFVADIFLFNLKDMQLGNLKVRTFVVRSLVRCAGFLCFILASILVYEIYPVKCLNLHRDFGRYYFRLEEKRETDLPNEPDIEDSHFDSVSEFSRLSHLSQFLEKNNPHNTLSFTE